MPKTSIRALLVLLALLPGLCLTPVARAAETKALVGGRLIDGFGGRPLADSVILIDGDTIEAVGTVESLPVPAGYEVLSTEGMDVLPGLWESHAHLMINGHADYPYWQATYKDRFADLVMPASAVQLLLAGVTTARDLGAPLAASLEVKRRIETGEIPGPRLFVSGPFLQHQVAEWESHYRWAVEGADDARAKVARLAEAGVDLIKLIDQDKMTLVEAAALVDEAHRRGLKVVAHSHRPDEIRRGLEIGVDDFEHTGLTTAPEYPPDVVRALRERTATGRIAGGPLFWTPTVEGLWNYEHTVDNPEKLDDPCWHRGLPRDVIEDIRRSIRHPGQLAYSQLTPLRRPTLKRKIAQLRESGVVFLVGTDSGIPMKFHCQSTWNELAVWVEVMGIPPMEAIRGATYWPAVMMGVADRWGTVSEGKLADVIAVRGDVLRTISLLQDVDFVMKGGVVYKREGRPVEAAFEGGPESGSDGPAVETRDREALDAEAIGRSVGAEARTAADGTVRVTWSRRETGVSVDGLRFPPAAGLTSWAAFAPTVDGAMLMGDTVLFQDEVSPAIDAALAHGLELTALHNHFFHDEPRVVFMHLGGRGEAIDLARGVGAVWSAAREVRRRGEPSRVFPGELPESDGTLDAEEIGRITGAEPSVHDGVVKVTIAREATMEGTAIGGSMGLTTWAAFTGSDERAAIDGDVAMTACEVQAVLRALRRAGIHVVALHNHMIGEAPAYYFTHFWGKGPAADLARGFRAALDAQSETSR